MDKVEIHPGCFSNHSPVILDIDFSKFEKGRGFWKFNNSLLYDPIYVESIKKITKKVTTQYSTINNDPNFFENASL